MEYDWYSLSDYLKRQPTMPKWLADKTLGEQLEQMRLLDASFTTSMDGYVWCATWSQPAPDARTMQLQILQSGELRGRLQYDYGYILQMDYATVWDQLEWWTKVRTGVSGNTIPIPAIYIETYYETDDGELEDEFSFGIPIPPKVDAWLQQWLQQNPRRERLPEPDDAWLDANHRNINLQIK